MIRRLRIQLIALLSAGVFASILGSGWHTWILLAGTGRLPIAAESAVTSITATELREHLRFLASDRLEGRGVGTSGNQQAERYLANSFERLRLEPTGGEGFYQPFALVTATLGEKNAFTVQENAEADDQIARYEVSDDFFPLRISAVKTVTGGLVFAGYGITAPDLGYDDYTGLDAAGKIAVVLDGEPRADDDESRFAGRRDTEYATVASKVRTAQAHHVLGLIVVPAADRDFGSRLDLRRAWPDRPSVRTREYLLAESLDGTDMAAAKLSRSAAERALAHGERQRVSLSSLQKEIDLALKGAGDAGPVGSPASFSVPGRQATLQVDLNRQRAIVHNVMAYLPGLDPILKNEVIVVGAHLDHDGVDAEDRIYNGADDNGSGTVAVLEIADAFSHAAAAGKRPQRSVVFALWNAEEKGLLGSTHFVLHPPAGQTIVANLNLDMIGRNEDVTDPASPRFYGFPRTTAAENVDTLHVLGYTYAPDMAAVVRDENSAVRLLVKMDYDTGAHRFITRSDDWPFLEHHIPALFFTTGLHPDYHTPRDDVDKIEFGKLQRIARLAYRVTWRLADHPERPHYVEPRKNDE